jgi:hypothetical protein
MSEPLATVKEMVKYHIKRFNEDITYINESLSELKTLNNFNDKELTKLMLGGRVLRIIDEIDENFRDVIFLPERLKNVFSVMEGEPSYKRFEKKINELIPLRDQIDSYLDKLTEIRFNLEIFKDNMIYEISDRINIDELDDFLIKYFLEHE